MRRSNPATPYLVDDRQTVAALTRPFYGRAFLPGCGTGDLTEVLAERCVQVVATDVDPQAVALTERRCQRFSNVAVQKAELADDPPAGTFDLIILREWGIRFAPGLLLRLILKMSARLQMGGELIAIHSRARQVLCGDEVHGLLAAHLPLEWQGGERHAGFRLDRWVRLYN